MAANALTGGGSLFAADDDPELVREATPFGLKTIEGLVEASPDNEKLRLAAASGFVQYAYAFLLEDAHRLEPDDPDAAAALVARARKLLDRARRHGLAGLEVEHEGFAAKLREDPARALAETDEDDVGLLYWTAAAWGMRISISKDDMDLLGDLPLVESMARRALALDEDYDAGAIHELLVSLEAGKGDLLGGNLEAAKAHLERSLALTGGKRIGVLVTWAESVAVSRQDRAEFDAYLDRALAFDPDSEPKYRLANLIAQDRARRLKARAGDLFLEE
jgi:predicted anti-sigma-YlaC factor YlaD